MQHIDIIETFVRRWRDGEIQAEGEILRQMLAPLCPDPQAEAVLRDPTSRELTPRALAERLHALNVAMLEPLVKALREVSHTTEAEEDAAILRLQDLSPDPNALDYLSGKEYDDLTPRQIAERMLAYRPIVL